MSYKVQEIGEVTKVCEKHGEYTAMRRKMMSMEFPVHCPKCLKEEKEIEAKNERDDLKKRREEQAEQLYKTMGIPKRYWHLKLKDITPTENQVLAYKKLVYFSDNFQKMADKGQCLVFCGGIGTGKTMLISALMQSLGCGMYIRAVDVSRTVRAAYGSNESELDIIQKFVDKPLLVIDEIGVQMNTEAEALLITDLIDRRYGEMKPTILMSNLDRDGVEKSLGQRAFSRIMQNGAIIPIKGQSNRNS